MKSLYCDFQYVITGHHDQDFQILNRYCDGNLEHIKYNEKKIIKNIFVISQVLKRNENKTIGTVSFLCLFLASFFTKKWNYNLVIHFFPSVHFKLYKFLFSIFIRKCKNIIVFADCVRQDLLQKTGLNSSSKIIEIHPREIQQKEKILNNKVTVLCIGNLNSMKLVEPLFSVIQKKKFTNINFKFICNGIQKRLENVNFKNICQNKIEIQDRFPSLDEYSSELYEASYVFFDYSKMYGVRFSGVLLDALSQGTPVICCNNVSFTSVVKKYNCGFVFNTEVELAMILEQIDAGKAVFPKISQELIDSYSERLCQI